MKLSNDLISKKETRQQKILRFLEEEEFVSVEQLSKRFSVTEQTARRDLVLLEENGKLLRTHGGARVAPQLMTEVRVRRRVANASEKARVARAVAGMIPEGASIFLDVGTTCEAIARELVARDSLKVVTYSLRSAATLNEREGSVVAVPGGFARPIDGAILDSGGPDFVRRFKFDFAIVAVSGIDANGDLCDDDPAEVAIVSAAMAQSRHKILAADHTAFGKTALVPLGTLRDIDTLVTDIAPTVHFASLLRQSGCRIVCPE